MSYSTLRVTAAGVVLFDEHARRLGDAEALSAFARTAAPGVYRVQGEPGALHFTLREESRLRDGMPLRRLPTPLPPGTGPIDKPPPPGPYDAVRAPGVATLLTAPDGSELYESCAAAVLAWDGARLLVPPDDRPRVRSTAEAALCRLGLCTRAPIAGRTEALLLVNALGLFLPAGSTFPAPLRERLARALAATTRR